MRFLRPIVWLYSKREKLLWAVGGTAALTVILLSCSTFETNRAILAPPSIVGAEFVGSESCETCHESITRNFRTAIHARLKAPGDNAKEMGCETCHGPVATRDLLWKEREISMKSCVECHKSNQ